MRALLLLTVASCASGAPPVAATPADAVALYFRAGDRNASRHVRAAFHPATPIQWVDAETGAARALTQIEWWPRLDDGAGAPATSRAQRTLDRSGDLALIEAVSTWSTHTFDDLLLVVRDGARWQIVGKVFVRLAPGEAAAASDVDAGAIRAVLEQKIAAHAEYDPALLLASHLPDCRYVHVATGVATHSTLSEAAARYAAKRDLGETDHESPWTIGEIVQRGPIAAATLEVRWQGVRHVDHLLLLRTSAGWKIAAAAWGPAE